MAKIKIPEFKQELGFETTEERSAMMKKMRSKETVPELLLRKALWKAGVRYRINVKNMPGKPDIVIRKSKLAIFVDGEFWHGYNWAEQKGKIISNRGYWIPKIERNMQRDEEADLALQEMGFQVIRLWSKRIRKDLDSCVTLILSRTN